MAVLRPIDGSPDLPLRNKINLIGRDPASDIVINSTKTSWRHAMIVQGDHGFAIEDLDSVNGTYVNGQRVLQRTPLVDGDRIELFGLCATFFDQTPGGHAGEHVERTDVSPEIMSSLDMSSGMRVEVGAEAKLRAVLELSRQLHASLDLREVLPRIIESLFNVFPQADRGFLLLRDSETGQMTLRASRFRRPHAESELPAISQGVIRYVLETGRAALSADAGHDERFDPFQSVHRFQICSIMCVPMLGARGEPVGILQLDTQERGRHFREEDLEVLVSASAQAARAVELAWLHEERRDLEAAVQIQKSFLPSERPAVPELAFFDYYSSARHVGGDYFDYIPLPDRRLAVALGDVSGKGVAAALLMARLSAAARFALASERSVPEAVRSLSRVLTRQATADRFITFVVLVVDLSDFSAVLVNAGHIPPLRIRGHEREVEDVGEAIVGVPLAVVDRPYEEMSLQLEPGDRIILCTDGVTEARNPAGDLYGRDRLREAILSAGEGAEEAGQTILNDVHSFASGRPQKDDLTIVCFERLPGPG